MTQIVSRPMLTYIFNFSWTKKCSLAAVDCVCCRSCQCSIQTFDCVCVCSRSVQYKQWQAKAGTRGDSRKDKMEMTKYIVMGFDCRRFSKPIRSNRKSCQNYLGQFLYLVAKMAKIYYPRPKDSQKVEERKHPKYIPWSVEKE